MAMCIFVHLMLDVQVLVFSQLYGKLPLSLSSPIATFTSVSGEIGSQFDCKSNSNSLVVYA